MAAREFVSIYREALPVLLVSLAGGLVSGVVLERVLGQVAVFPGLLVMVPVFLATRGNIYGALGARISSGLHQGLIQPRLERNDRLVNAVFASFINAVGISVVIAVISWVALQLMGWESASLLAFLLIMLVAGVLTSIVLILGLLILIFWGFNRGYDPDNLVGPIVTTLGDIFGMLFLLLATMVVGVML
ncbi:MAG: magnesium transporter [Halodesulfurarchaeum sp.]